MIWNKNFFAINEFISLIEQELNSHFSFCIFDILSMVLWLWNVILIEKNISFNMINKPQMNFKILYFVNFELD